MLVLFTCLCIVCVSTYSFDVVKRCVCVVCVSAAFEIVRMRVYCLRVLFFCWFCLNACVLFAIIIHLLMLFKSACSVSSSFDVAYMLVYCLRFFFFFEDPIYLFLA